MPASLAATGLPRQSALSPLGDDAEQAALAKARTEQSQHRRPREADGWAALPIQPPGEILQIFMRAAFRRTLDLPALQHKDLRPPSATARAASIRPSRCSSHHRHLCARPPLGTALWRPTNSSKVQQSPAKVQPVRLPGPRGKSVVDDRFGP